MLTGTGSESLRFATKQNLAFRSRFTLKYGRYFERLYQHRSSNSAPLFRIKDAKRAIAAACRRFKLPASSHRSFRRMFITRAIEKGIDVKVIAEWQGHKDGGKLILDTYSHLNRAHSDRMAMY